MAQTADTSELVPLERTRAGSIIRPPTGRTTTYTDAIGRSICQYIQDGMTKRGACGLVGVDEDTFRTWMETRGDFTQMLARAEGIAEQVFTQAVISTAQDRNAPGDWRPAIEWLKRRRRADYGDSVDIRRVDTEQLRQLLNLQADDLTEEVPAIAASAEELI